MSMEFVGENLGGYLVKNRTALMPNVMTRFQFIQFAMDTITTLDLQEEP